MLNVPKSWETDEIKSEIKDDKFLKSSFPHKDL